MDRLRSRSSNGFGLVEIMIGLAIVAVIGGAVMKAVAAKTFRVKEQALDGAVSALFAKASVAYSAYCHLNSPPPVNASTLISGQFIASADLKQPLGSDLSVSFNWTSPAYIEISAPIANRYNAQSLGANLRAYSVSGNTVRWRRKVSVLAATRSAESMAITQFNEGTRCD